MTSEQRATCIGFGPFDNRRKDGPGCANVADTPAELWCQRCEALRREHISAQFAEINAVRERRSDDRIRTSLPESEHTR